MKTSLFVTLALAVALTGCNKSTRSASADANDTSRPADSTASAATTTNTVTGNTTTDRTLQNDMNRLGNDMQSAASSAGSAMNSMATNVATTARIVEWKLTANDIQPDLDAKRDIVRTKDAVGAPTGSADRSTIKSMVNSRLQADSSIAALKLDVNATSKGEIELEGKALNAEQVGRAIALALDTEGVTKVTSKVRLDKDAGQ